jgi:hypothetical protein
MATRSKTTYNKRQKEFARLEKQRDKAAKRMQKKLEPKTGESYLIEGIDGETDLLDDSPENATEAVPEAEVTK